LIAVIRSPFSALTSFLIHKSHLLEARVIQLACLHHVWLLFPEPGSSTNHTLRVQGASLVMKPSEF
jgi:hypothetical protein